MRHPLTKFDLISALRNRSSNGRSSRFALSSVLILSLMLAAGTAIAQVDTDGDGVFDDGDASGSPYDNPCPDGLVSGCDDNCRAVSNPGQIDVLEPFGVGDECQAPTESVDLYLVNGQQEDFPTYRWRGSGDPFQLPAAAVSSTLPVSGGGSCGFLDFGFAGVQVAFTEPIGGPSGGLACCPWEAKCNLFCQEQAPPNFIPEPSNDCDATVTCDPFTTSVNDCSNLRFGVPAIQLTTPEEREELGQLLQDATGVCAGLSDVPIASCCFQKSRTVDRYWGSEAGNPAEFVDVDDDLANDGCDNCVGIENVNQADADGEGRGDACDSYSNSRWVCSDVDGDGCDDCSYGSFNPDFDGEVNPPNGICIPEPGFTLMLIVGLANSALLGKRRDALKSRS